MYRLRSLNSRWLLLTALPILLAPPRALALPPRCTDNPACRDHLDQGVALTQARQPERALVEFEAAYTQTKDPRVALQIGSTLHDLGRFAEAIKRCQEAERADASDAPLQAKAQTLIERAQQNLRSVNPRPIRIVNDPSLTLQTSPVQVTSMATAINNNVKIDMGSLLAGARAETKPLYRRAGLWGPVVGLALAASAAGLTAALWPRPWQPDPSLPHSDFMAITVGGVK